MLSNDDKSNKDTIALFSYALFMLSLYEVKHLGI